MLPRFPSASALAAGVFALAALMTCSSPRTLSLTAADDGKTITVSAGTRFVVSLPGNISTGFSWEPDAVDTAFLAQAGDVEVRPEDPVRPGSGGTMALTFRALKPGRTELRLAYRRPWEKDAPPVKTFRVAVVIR